MYNKVGYTVVGIFVLLFGMGMVWFAFWLNNATGSQEFNPYRVTMKDSIAGLSKDASVKLHGVHVGRVSNIRINPKNIEEVEIMLLIDKKIPIKEDMIIHTQMVGVTGLLALEIDGGTNQAKTLHIDKSGDIPTIRSQASLLTSLSSRATPMIEDVGNLLHKMEKLLSNENMKNIENILKNVEHLTSRTDGIEKRVFTSLDNADNALKEIQKLLKTIEPVLIKSGSNFTTLTKDFHKVSDESITLFKNIQSSTKNINRLSQNMNRLTLKFGKSLKRGDYNMKKIFEPMLVDIGRLTKQLGDISRQIEQNPKDLLFKSRKSRRGPGE